MKVCVPEYRLPDLQTRVNALVSKCDRKGLSGSVVVTYGDRTERRERHVDSFGVEFYTSTWWVPVTLECDPPKFNGWQFAATIQQVDGSDTHLLRCSPAYAGGKIPDYFRDCDPTYCEHCKARRNRTETFVVFNAERTEFRQVGRQCLRDFLGHDPAGMIAAAGYITEAVESLSEFAGEGTGFRSARSWPVDYVLSLAARVVAVDGWKPKAFEERSTASALIGYLLLGNTDEDRRSARNFAETYPESTRAMALFDRVMARAVELAAKSIGDMTSDYEANLWTIVRAKSCNSGHIGLVASMLAYAVKQENESVKKGETSASRHVGTIGDRMRGVPATVVFTKTFDGQYGATTLIKFNASGNLLAWWASGVPDVAAGESVELAGTVKAHDQDAYAKCPVTVLSRCKIIKAAVAA